MTFPVVDKASLPDYVASLRMQMGWEEEDP